MHFSKRYLDCNPGSFNSQGTFLQPFFFFIICYRHCILFRGLIIVAFCRCRAHFNLCNNVAQHRPTWSERRSQNDLQWIYRQLSRIERMWEFPTRNPQTPLPSNQELPSRMGIVSYRLVFTSTIQLSNFQNISCRFQRRRIRRVHVTGSDQTARSQ